MKHFLFTTSIIFVLILINTGSILAIPSFARKYGISCRTCHSPAVPKLKPYGDEFAGNAFKLTDYESPRYFMDTGDPKLSLLREFPLAVRLEGFATFNMADDEKTDLGLPFNLKILSGGQISEHLAYYFYFYMSERGEIAGVEDAYLMYNNLFNSELDIYAGQFQVSDPLFKRELRLSLEDYEVYGSKIGVSDISLKYDKGLMFTYGFKSGTDLVFEVVNGNGLQHADEYMVFDKDKYKNLVGRISQDIGKHIRIGVFGYYGKEELFFSSLTNEVIFKGADATFSSGEIFQLNLQYMNRTDERVFDGFETLGSANTNGFMAELLYSPGGDDSKWYALGLLNHVDSDYDPADYASGTLHAGYILKRNVRLVAEYTWDFTIKDYQFGRASVGFVSAF